MAHYSGIVQPPRTEEERERTLEAVSRVFGADVAKCCHHGSADVSDDFLRGVHPAATVISSGDENSHAHPRCDSLGAIGLHGRGWRPLIFSTELARSTREREDRTVLKKIGRLEAQMESAAETDRETLRSERDRLLSELASRNVTTYGAVNLRTDGRKVVMAYKLERKGTTRSGGVREWDIYKMEPAHDGSIAFVNPSPTEQPAAPGDSE